MARRHKRRRAISASQDQKQQDEQAMVEDPQSPMSSWRSMRMKAKHHELQRPLDSLEPVSARSTTSLTVHIDHGASTV